MHPMFVKLYLEPDADDLPAEDEARRRASGIRLISGPERTLGEP